MQLKLKLFLLQRLHAMNTAAHHLQTKITFKSQHLSKKNKDFSEKKTHKVVIKKKSQKTS